MQQPFLAAISRNGKTWRFKRALLQKEEPCQAKTSSNIKFLQDLLSDKTKTSEGKVVFNLEYDYITNNLLMHISSYTCTLGCREWAHSYNTFKVEWTVD